MSLHSHVLPLPTKWPDITTVISDRERGAEFNCPCSTAERAVHGNACFSAEIASMGKLLSESPPGHKPGTWYHALLGGKGFWKAYPLPVTSSQASTGSWSVQYGWRCTLPLSTPWLKYSALESWSLVAQWWKCAEDSASHSPAISKRWMCSLCSGVASDLAVSSWAKLFYGHHRPPMQCFTHQSMNINMSWEGMHLMHAVVHHLLKSYCFAHWIAGRYNINLSLSGRTLRTRRG